MWKYLLTALFLLSVTGGLWGLIRSSRLRSRLWTTTGLVPADVLRWANDTLEGGGFTWTKILREESDRFVLAVIKPLPPLVRRGTPPHEVVAVEKADGRIHSIPKDGYGIGIK